MGAPSIEQWSAGKGPAMPVKTLPEPPRAAHVLGPGAILAAMGIGMGELLMWPRAVVMWGEGVLWLCLLGITFQYVVTMEMGRWATATGESIFTGAWRIGAKGIFMWMFFVYALILYCWPGWLATSGQALEVATGVNWRTWVLVGVLLIFVGLSSTKTVYTAVEWIQTATVLFSIIVAALVAAIAVPPDIMARALAGWFQFGYWHPEMSTAANIDFLVGSMAYAGPSGMQQMWYTLWLRDDGAGMGAYIPKIKAAWVKEAETVPSTGFMFDFNNPEEMRKWKGWRMWNLFDAAVLFWFFTVLLTWLFTLFALTAIRLDPALVAAEKAGKTLPILKGMANVFGSALGGWAFYAFLLVAFIQVWNTAYGVYDGYARGQADMVYFGVKRAQRWTLRRWYYIFLWTMLVVIAVTGSGLFEQPLPLVILATSLACPVMGMYCALLLYVNMKFLPKPIRMNWVHFIALLAACVFYFVGTYWIVYVEVILKYFK